MPDDRSEGVQCRWSALSFLTGACVPCDVQGYLSSQGSFMFTALIADDHPFIRQTVQFLLKKEEFGEIYQASNGADAMQIAREKRVDLIILDLGMTKLGGLEVISRIKALGLPCKILVLTGFSAEHFSARCMRAGAMGFVSKTGELDELQKAIKAVMSNYSCFPSLPSSSVRRDDLQSSEGELVESLSDRELAVLQMLALGLGNNEIASRMLLSHKTISTYKTRLKEKLNIDSVVHMAKFAQRNGLI
ncbi:two-component system, NarL family, response regulator EvgA [Pseudomonas tolaasii]